MNVGLPRESGGRVAPCAPDLENPCGPLSRRQVESRRRRSRRPGRARGEQRAVFVYQIESYRYWQEQLRRTDFVHGQFGENFTVEGLPDDAVCIGDRYQIGSALFEVTQPRVTCFASAFG